MSTPSFNRSRLGRLPRTPDLRDHLFLAAPPKAAGVRSKFWYTSPPLDQGDKPYCVAFSGVGFLDSAPIRNRSFKDTTWLYKQCQMVDEWQGEDYDGTSVRALFKVLKREGFVEKYQWAFDVNTIANWILTTGPVVVGTIWTDDMFNVSKRGFITLGSGEGTSMHAGGHAYLLKGVNLDTVCPDGSKGAFRIFNSWGKNWGQGGCASISFKDFAVLLREGGEGCMAKEILKG